MRQTTIFFCLITAATLSFTACSSGGGDDGGGGDDAPDIDASTSEDPDANTNPGTRGLGSSCVPDTATPPGQGDCPAGFVCLGLDGATGPYCTKTCATGAGTDPIAQCDPGFDQAGLGYCFLGVDFTGDMMADEFYCGIICSDTTGVCTDCNSSCPGNYLQCTAPLMDNNGNTVAQGCQ